MTSGEVVPVPASRLPITTQPTNAVLGSVIAPAITVQVRDAAGIPVTSSTASVTLAIGINAGSGTLSGTKTVNAVNGVAMFSDLSIDEVGTGYTLVASSDGLTDATSNSFNINTGPATQIAVAVGNDQSVTVGTAVSTPPGVLIRDASGNPVAGVQVTFAVASGGGKINPASPATVTTGADGIAAGALSGVVGEDDVTVSAVATYDDAAVGAGKTITVVYTLGGAQAGNYTLTQPSLSANITAATLTVTPNADQTKVFGTNNPVLAYTVTPAVALTGALRRVAGEEVGTYPFTLGDLSAGVNYTLVLADPSPTRLWCSAGWRPLQTAESPSSDMWWSTEPLVERVVAGAGYAWVPSLGLRLRSPGSKMTAATSSRLLH